MNRWEYLVSDPYLVRHSIAAHFVDTFSTKQNEPMGLIEVGAYKKSVWQYLRHPENILNPIILDPLKSTDSNCVPYLPLSIKEASRQNYFGTMIPNDYVLVVLGVDINGQKDFEILMNLAKNARMIILEVAHHYPPGMQQFNNLLEVYRQPELMRISFKMPDVSIPGYPVFTHRILVVSQRK